MIISRLARGYRSRRRASVALLKITPKGGADDDTGGDAQVFHQFVDRLQQFPVGPAGIRIGKCQDSVIFLQTVDIRVPELLTAQSADKEGQNCGTTSAKEITESVSSDFRFLIGMCFQE